MLLSRTSREVAVRDRDWAAVGGDTAFGHCIFMDVKGVVMIVDADGPLLTYSPSLLMCPLTH